MTSSLSPPPVLVHTLPELAAVREAMTGTVAVVPTMGALHDGHFTLMRRARDVADFVIVTVFVNPLQFRPGEDFSAYPRTLESDVDACQREGVDVVFAPAESEIYPHGREQVTRVIPGPLGDVLEGASRPGFFTGVLTVVAKLFTLTRPHKAMFGQKDYQQATLVAQMSRDLNLGVDVVAMPIVRDDDGLAMSSRNAYLSAEERDIAAAIPGAVRAAQLSPDPLEAARKMLETQPGLEIDYVAVTDPNLGPDPAEGPARLLIAARVGTTRLIDNAPVHVGNQDHATATGLVHSTFDPHHVGAPRPRPNHHDAQLRQALTSISHTETDTSSDPATSVGPTTHIGDRDA